MLFHPYSRIQIRQFPIHTNTVSVRPCSASHIHIPNLHEHAMTCIHVDPSFTVFRKIPVLARVQ